MKSGWEEGPQLKAAWPRASLSDTNPMHIPVLLGVWPSIHISTIFLPLSCPSCPSSPYFSSWPFISGWTGTKLLLSGGNERNLRMPVFTSEQIYQGWKNQRKGQFFGHCFIEMQNLTNWQCRHFLLIGWIFMVERILWSGLDTHFIFSSQEIRCLTILL